MKRDEHYNIKENLNQVFKVYGDLLDVGCGIEYTNLIDFEKSKFETLIGFDKELKDNQTELVNYFYLYNNRNVEKLEFNELYLQRHEFISKHLLDFEYQVEKYGLIVCTSLLHFFCDEIKMTVIDAFFKALIKEGLIFIRINNSQHSDYNNGKRISENIIFNSNKKEVKYLIDDTKFNGYLKERNYNILDNLSFNKNGVTTIVIRK